MSISRNILFIGIIVLVLLFSNLVMLLKLDRPVRILNLVLYSMDDDGPFDRMQKITERYYSTFSNVTTYYYCFSPDLDVPHKLDGNILYIQGDETFVPGILEKTVNAFEYFENQIHENDYVVRSNISTIIRFDLLSEDLKKNAVDYGCALCWGTEYLKHRSQCPPNEFIFSSGTSIIFSKDVVLNIIINKDKLDKELMDDVSIGKFIMEEMPEIEMRPVMKHVPYNGFHYMEDMGEDEEKIRSLIENKKIMFFRNNTDDREVDVKQMEIIVNILS